LCNDWRKNGRLEHEIGSLRLDADGQRTICGVSWRQTLGLRHMQAFAAPRERLPNGKEVVEEERDRVERQRPSFGRSDDADGYLPVPEESASVVKASAGAAERADRGRGGGGSTSLVSRGSMTISSITATLGALEGELCQSPPTVSRPSRSSVSSGFEISRTTWKGSVNDGQVSTSHCSVASDTAASTHHRQRQC
jgi:hypothetical protein